MFTTIILPAVIKIAVAIGICMGIAPLLTWAERRQSAMAQDRRGPNRAGAFGFTLLGLLHPLADGIKMITKEDFVPEQGDRFLFTLAPMMAVFSALVVWVVIPFGPEVGSVFGIPIGKLVVADLDVGILALFALVSLGAYGAALAGWAGNNKYGLLGGLRASAQMISYEVVLGLTIMGIFMHFGTLQLTQIVELQGAQSPAPYSPLYWGFMAQPLGLVLFLTAAIAETKRAPFDLPEGESEIIGYFIEYSALRFGVFYLSEFIAIITVSALTTVLFFGGYHLPFLGPDGLHLPGGVHLAFQIPQLLWVLLGVGVFLGKVILLCALQIQIRWTYPRFRYDQLMSLCWKVLLPVALVNIAITGVALTLGEGAYGIAVWVGLAELLALIVYVWPRPATPARTAG